MRHPQEEGEGNDGHQPQTKNIPSDLLEGKVPSPVPSPILVTDLDKGCKKESHTFYRTCEPKKYCERGPGRKFRQCRVKRVYLSDMHVISEGKSVLDETTKAVHGFLRNLANATDQFDLLKSEIHTQIKSIARGVDTMSCKFSVGLKQENFELLTDDKAGLTKLIRSLSIDSVANITQLQKQDDELYSNASAVVFIVQKVVSMVPLSRNCRLNIPFGHLSSIKTADEFFKLFDNLDKPAGCKMDESEWNRQRRYTSKKMKAVMPMFEGSSRGPDSGEVCSQKSIGQIYKDLQDAKQKWFPVRFWQLFLFQGFALFLVSLFYFIALTLVIPVIIPILLLLISVITLFLAGYHFRYGM
eukprot:TRINITY_DN66907_c0_g1_i1.p1 TRINITY_DN66907_c0_g1~~TRINITY_DN66907_c0_g1_i1.p1  ORF type:complete len:404 (+),score=33.61 TRINITY_DN66907_c0_g1_i1:146-1213(+)